ncbi:hypothetical protein CDD83_7538 [Cordyceps sp. RAO-2017]|nr:hypothetical protein CDD83_7538 [Cordyceps sp. RAO-2017]
MEPPLLPRVTIRFCTQCRWMLRAAYYAQELLSTFGPALAEVALQPATGGAFAIAIQHGEAAATTTTTTTLLWDRARDGGFPETKELKRRVRDVVQPGRDLGHVDRGRARDGEGEGERRGGEARGEGEGGGGREGETRDDGDEEKKDGRACDDCAP